MFKLASNDTSDVTAASQERAQVQAEIAADVPDDSEWQQVHPLTPIVDALGAIFVVLSIIFIRNSNELWQLRQLGFEVILGIVVAIMVLAIVVGVISGYIAYRFIRYAITEDAIHYKSGMLFRSHRKVTLNRVQAMDLITPLIPRLFGVTKLRIESAGGSDSHIEIKYLKSEKAQALRAEISERIAGNKPTVVRELAESEGDSEVFVSVVGDSRARAVGTNSVISHLNTHEGLDDNEYPVLKVPGTRLVLAAISTPGFFVALLFATTMVVVIWAGAQEIILQGAIPLLIIPVSYLWSRVAQQWDFVAAITRHGLRIHRGLLNTTSQTLPPGRIHAIELYQPLLWRLGQWWRADVTVAGWGAGVNGEDSKMQLSTILPVGTADDAIMTIWIAVRDLGIDCPREVLQEAMEGVEPSERFIGVGMGARWMDPLVKNRRGVCITDTVVIIRDGFLHRRVSIIPHEHAQSITLKQGPIQRYSSVTSISLNLVAGSVKHKIRHQPLQRAQKLAAELVERSRIRLQVEPLDDWMKRLRTEHDLRATDV